MRMPTLAFVCVIPVTLVYAQSTQPPAAPPPAEKPPAATNPQAPAEPTTVEQTASPELVGQLVNDLGITPKQAQGAAGTLFGLAKSKLSVDDFAKVAGAVPNMEGLLKAAPLGDAKSSATDVLTGQLAGAGGLGAVASVAGPLTKLGIKPETIAKLAPTLVKAVQSKGGAEVAGLLAGAFK
jgi:Protein of unknown function VcgC/VcgE (DUF2780)